MDKLVLEAYAKVNLGLDVVRKRPDGYHEVKMIMQTVTLADTLEFEILDEDKIRIEADVEGVPTDESNLIWKAIAMLRKEYGIKKGVHVTLYKRIPVAAGMAGGSTDCAAALKAVNQLFSLGLTEEELRIRGVKLGADVPYCIMEGTALSEGIGEILTPIAPMPECYLVIAKPNISVSTAFVYGNLHVDTLEKHPDIDGIREALEQGDLDGITCRLENVLETVTEPAHPVITKIKECMLNEGALSALMSGSGPTVFGIFQKGEDARACAKVLEETMAEGTDEDPAVNQIYVVKPYNQ